MELLKELIEAVKSIPLALWTAVFGSAFTLGGVLISNSNNTKRLKIQLAHDASEKDKERRISMRRVAYMEICDELTKASAFIGALSTRDLSDSKLADETRGLNSAISKAGLVAEDATVLKLSIMAERFTKTLADAFDAAAPVSSAASSIKIKDEYIEKESAEIDRLRLAISMHLESGSVDEDVLSALRLAKNSAYERRESWYAERSAAHEARMKALSEYMKFLAERVPELASDNLEMMAALRLELGIATDFKAMRDALVERQKSLQAVIAKAGEKAAQHGGGEASKIAG